MRRTELETMYSKIRTVVPDEETYRAVIGIIEAEHIEAERHRKEIQAEGIEKARQAQVHLGRPRKQKPKSYQKVMGLYFNREITIAQAAALLGISPSVCYTWIREEREKQALAAEG